MGSWSYNPIFDTEPRHKRASEYKMSMHIQPTTWLMHDDSIMSLLSLKVELLGQFYTEEDIDDIDYPT